MSSDDPKEWMWRHALDLLDEADRLHRRFFQVSAVRGRRPTWEPPVDVFEHEGRLLVTVALPGVARERMRVGVDRDALVIAGERPLPKVLCRAEVHRLEIPYGRFERRVSLPSGLWELERLEVSDGCLQAFLNRLR